MSEKVEHQGTVVEVPDKGITGADAVIQEGQGLVFRTEENRFGTLGADGFYHGYVPSTQVRDILMGQGEPVDETVTTPMDEALDKAKAQGAKQVAGSEAPFPTGDVEAAEDTGPNIAPSDRDETLTPMTAEETAKANKGNKP